MLSQAQLLDELMGRDRNLAPQDKKCSVHWSDPGVCKTYIAGFCPHDLFTNTRSDLGYCSKLHDDKLREEYNNSSRYGSMGYEEDFLRYLQTLLSDVDRRIRRGHSRLSSNAEMMKERTGPSQLDNDTDREKEAQLSEKVNSLVEQAEKLGCEGKVEEAQGVMKLVDQLKEEREMLNAKNRDPTFNGQEKQMEVCEVCGAFLIIGDAQIRVDDHLQGKQHKGYAQIKSAVEELKKRPWLDKMKSKEKAEAEKGEEEKAKPEETEVEEKDRRSDRDKDNKDRDRDRGRRDRDRDGRRDRDQTRGRDRDHRRDHDGDRSRDKRRERSRERRRSRSRDRKRRDDNASRGNSRDRDDDRRRERSGKRERGDDKHGSREDDKHGLREDDKHGSREDDKHGSREEDTRGSRGGSAEEEGKKSGEKSFEESAEQDEKPKGSHDGTRSPPRSSEVTKQSGWIPVSQAASH